MIKITFSKKHIQFQELFDIFFFIIQLFLNIKKSSIKLFLKNKVEISTENFMWIPLFKKIAHKTAKKCFILMS